MPSTERDISKRQVGLSAASGQRSTCIVTSRRPALRKAMQGYRATKRLLSAFLSLELSRVESIS